MATGCPYLIRRGAIYYARRRLPFPLNEILGRSHYTVSLRTAEPTQARQRVRALAVLVDSLCMNIRRATPKRPSRGQLRLVLDHLFDEIIIAGRKERDARPPGTPLPWELGRDHELNRDGTEGADEGGSHPEDEGCVLVSSGDEALTPEGREIVWTHRASMDDAAEVRPLVERAMRAHGLSMAADDPEFDRLCRNALKVVRHAHKVDRLLWEGTFDGPLAPPAWVEHAYPLHTRPDSRRLIAAEVHFLARPISAVGREFIESRKGSLNVKAERDGTTAILYFVDLVGDLRLGDISDIHIREFKKALRKMPRQFGKGIYSRLTPRQAIHKAEALAEAITTAEIAGEARIRFEGHDWTLDEARKRVGRLRKATVNKHLIFFTAMWNSDEFPKSLRSMNPFTGSIFKKKEIREETAKRGGRTEFTDRELAALFSSPVWRGCESIERRSRPGTLIIPDARFWCPLLALFTGMRREEVCTLRSGDFDEYDGIYFVRIDPTRGRSRKSSSARREIPIHSELIRIGLRDFVESVGPNAPLFPELSPSRADGVRGDPLGKWFQRYRLTLDKAGYMPYDDSKDFYSLRHSFTQRLRRAGVPLDQIKPITGHQEQAITITHYAPAFSLKQKKKVIERLRVGADFSRLYGRMPSLLEAYSMIRTRNTYRMGPRRLRRRVRKTGS